MSNTSMFAFALENASRLDRDLAIALDHANVLSAHTYDAARTLGELRRTLSQSLLAARGLRDRLLIDNEHADGEYLETVLRERSAAIVTRLADLALAEYEGVPSASQLYTGRFTCLLDVNAHVIDALGKINEMCFRARLDAGDWRDEDTETRRNAYRTTLSEAKRLFSLIGGDPDLLSFLRVGAALSSESFGAACRAVASLLGVSTVVSPAVEAR